PLFPYTTLFRSGRWQARRDEPVRPDPGRCLDRAHLLVSPGGSLRGDDPAQRQVARARLAETESPLLGGHTGELRDDVLAVRLERLLLPVRHQVDVELVDADRLEVAELLDRLLGRAEDREPVADLVADELAVLRADARVPV